MNATRPHWSLVNIGSGNGLLASWLGAVSQQAITWANVDLDPCRLMTSLGHNELRHNGSIFVHWVFNGQLSKNNWSEKNYKCESSVGFCPKMARQTETCWNEYSTSTWPMLYDSKLHLLHVTTNSTSHTSSSSSHVQPHVQPCTAPCNHQQYQPHKQQHHHIKSGSKTSPLAFSLLTHLPLDKMAAITQTIFSDAFSWVKSFVF